MAERHSVGEIRQLENIGEIEKRLWAGADTLRANSNFASNEYFLPVMGLICINIDPHSRMETHYMPKANISAADMRLLARSIEFAARKHRMQRRKDVDASPYINHPVALMSVLCVEGGVCDVVVLSAAMLHDTIEDTETTFEELEKKFGKEIVGIVAEVTDDKSLPKAERKRLQIEQAPHKSFAASLVKVADKISNLRDIAAAPPADWSVERRREYFAWGKAVVDRLPHVPADLRAVFDEIFATAP